MTEKTRMPQLVVDEVILLVNSYFKFKEATTRTEKNNILKELSDNMRSLPFFPEYKENPEFRSVAGMQMCISNVGFIDPENSSKFGHGSALQKKIFNRYADRKEDLSRLSKAIVEVSKKSFPIEYSFSDSELGMLVPSYHIFLERKNKVISSILKELKANEQTICKVCGKDLADSYKNGSELLEVHLSIPIYSNVPGQTPSPSEMIGICPTCHKLAHSSYESFEYDRVKELIK